MKEIFSKLNFMETPAESGERMSRFEQERYFEDFASQTKHTAAPQTPIRMTARKVLATAACAAIVLGVTGGAGYGIWQLYRNTPVMPPVAASQPEDADPVPAETTAPIPEETTAPAVEQTEVPTETQAADAAQPVEQAETLRMVSYQRDENGFLRMQLEADAEIDETLLVQALLANGAALQYSWGTRGQEGMNCIEIATRIPADTSELELHHNNAPLTFDVSEITHKGLAVCDNGNVMISSLGVSFTNDSSLLPWLKENLLTVGIDKRTRTPMGEVEYREKDPTVLPQVIRRALFMNEYSAPLEVNGTWIDGYIFFQMYEGEKVISPEIQFDKLSYITIGNLRVQSSGEPVRDFCYDTEEDFQPSATESTGIVIYKETLSATTTVTATE